MTFKLALYKGTRPGFPGIANRLGRFFDRGPYSHCEVVFSDGISASSSFEDGGVRFKKIGYSTVDAWDFYELPADWEVAARAWYVKNQGLPYDIWGNVRFFCGLARDSSDKWFCSESAAASFGFIDAFRYGPDGLLSTLASLKLVRKL